MSGTPISLLAGTYACKALGRLRDIVSYPSTVTVIEGRLTRVPVKLKERVVPVRVRVVDEQGSEHEVGALTIQCQRRPMLSSSALMFGGVHWVSPGLVTVTVRLGAHGPKVVREFDLPEEMPKQPIELRVVVP